jgi:hypothetical protein
MPNNDRASKAGVRTLVAIVAVIVAFAFFVWGPTSGNHVASNPGPSGIPGSTIINPAPPPANGPSGTTTGTAR